LFKVAEKTYGGTQAEGKFTPKDAYDAMELGVNQYLLEHKKSVGPLVSVETAKRNIENIRKEILEKLPTQTKRTQEMDEFQQFSTPPNLAYVAAWTANITNKDTVLEPSAGVGGLAVFGKTAGAKVIANELSPRRAALLKELGFDRVFTENAEQLANILPDDVKPTVVLMNPPFSSTAGRLKGKTSTKNAIPHIEQALKRLEPGGRLVAIVGRGMADNAPTFRDWWGKIKKEYNVRANIGIDGKNYAKYGTSFDVQLAVIDKTGPTPEGGTITGKVTELEDILPMLEVVKNDRGTSVRESTPAEPAPAEPTGQEIPQEGGRGPGPGSPVRVPADRVGAGGRSRVGERAERPEDRTGEPAPGLAEAGEVGLPGAGEKTNVLEPSREDHGPTPEERADRLPGRRSVGRPEGAGEAEVAGGRGAVPGGEPAGSAGGGRTAEQPAGLKVEAVETPRTEEELTDAVYTPYQPQKLKIPGAKPHPTNLAQSAAMAAVEPPDPTYAPNLPKEVIEQGKLSNAQLEAVVYAGQLHQQTLPDGQRKGFFIGDGTGTGKGRELAGIILDNMRRGREKAVWISKNAPLFEDAKRDFSDIGGDPQLIFDFGKIKRGTPIKQKEGVLFTTYDTLKRGLEVSGRGKVAVKKGQKANIDQIIEWLGEDFDGVIAFDEAHQMRNSLPAKGKRGMTKPSVAALAGVELQKRLPKARIVYASATGATEVYNLAYAERLGLWGKGTPFANKADFVNKVQAGGLAAMELVARDMKAMGAYLARNLDFTGVTYGTLEHKLTREQTEIYDTIAKAWQIVLQNLHTALEATGQNLSHNKGQAYSQFWGAHQRFFNQIVTSMQMPSVIEQVKKDLADGNAVVMQLVNTNEAIQNRRLSQRAKTEEGIDLEDIDLTPRDVLMQYLDKSFPTQQYEKYTDQDGNTRSRQVLDSHGNPVHNREALAMKEELMTKLGAVKVPDGPLEIVLNTFGVDNVAEVTGRTRRIVWVKDEFGRVKPKLENRTPRHAAADATAFMDDKKQILIFSDAGGTGRSYHADLTKKNQRRRIHYLIQPGWRADNAVQGFGRTHRSNEASAPHYVLVTTNLKGQKRFISSIARKLDQLGALTKGQRQASQGLFSEKDNLESNLTKDALQQFYEDLTGNQIPDLNAQEVLGKMGLASLIDERGNLKEVPEVRDITKFLNRLLSLESSLQNRVFDAFSSRLDEAVEAAIASGTLDVGLETFRADKVKVVKETTVYTDEKSGAETKYVELEAAYKNYPTTFKEASGLDNLIGFYQNTRSGKVYAVRKWRQKTLESGNVVNTYRLHGPDRVDVVTEDQFKQGNWKNLTREEARKLWDKAVKEAPEYQTKKVHLITGILLPIWDRLPEGHVRVIRVKTDDGRVLLGRTIPERALDITLRKLGAEKEKQELSTDQIADKVLQEGYAAYLANGWRIVRRRVSGEYRIELIGKDLYAHMDQLQSEGVFPERINYETRFFIPTGEKAVEVLDNVIKYRPIVDVVAPAETETGKAETLAGQAFAEEKTAETPKTKPPEKVVVKINHQPSGGREWVAEITGTDPKYKLRRKFVSIHQKDWSSSGKTGTTSFKLEESKIYEINEPYNGRRFVIVKNGEAEQITAEEVTDILKKAEIKETESEEKAADKIKQTIKELNQEVAPKLEMQEKYKGAYIAANIIDKIRSKNEVKLSDPEVEVVLNAWGMPRYLKEHAKAVVKGIGDMLKDVFVYEWRLKDFPQFVDDLRKFQGVARDAQVWGLNAMRGVLGHLESPKEFELFRRMVVLRDLKEGLENEEIAPRKITLEQVERAIKELEPRLNQNIRLALEAHDRLMKAVWEELKARGKVPEEAEGRKHYFPHRIMDYVRDFDRRFPAIARRFKTPYRYYLQERKGSVRDIDTDYTGVTMKHLMKVFIDNATDDFAEKIAERYDKWPELSEEEKKKIGKLIPGRLYDDINGERCLAWQYNPGRQIYPDSSVEEKVALDIAEEIAAEKLLPEEAAERMKEALKTKPAIGRYKKTYLLPEEIALRLLRLREPNLKSHLFMAVRDATRWWKGWVLGPLGAGLPFQTMNFIGDVMNLYREDPRALLYLAQGWKATAQWQKNVIGPEFKRLIQLAEDTRVLEAGLMTRRGGLPYDPHLAKLEPQRYIGRKINPFERYSLWSERRELTPRLAKLIADLHRIDKGQMPQVKMFNAKKLASAGMTKEEIAGKVAREFAVDYGKLTSEQREVLRDILFPFMTFYAGNFQNWISYATRNPSDAVIKFVVPFAAMCLWNWSKFEDTEEKLPLYYRVMPHLITGYKTPDGRPVIVAFQTPADLAAQILGLEIVPDLARQVTSGKKTIDEAALELAKNAVGAVPEESWQLFNPFFKAPIEAAMNKNTFTGAPIVPERLKGTPEDKRRRRNYILQQWFAPYAQYVRAARELEPQKGFEWLFKGPYSVKRALGVREVNVGREQVNRFFDYVEELEGKERWLKEELKKGRKLTADERKDMLRLKYLRRVRNVLYKDFAAKREIQALDRYTPEQKKKMFDRIDRRIAKIAEIALKKAGAANK